MRVVRWWVAAIGCVGAATAGLWSARAGREARDPLAQLVREVEPYPSAPFVALGDQIQSDGIVRTLAHAQTHDAPARVVDHYERVWRARGLDVQRSAGDDEAWAIATLPREPLIRTVVATSTPSTLGRRTAIIASLSEKRTASRTALVKIAPACDVLTNHAAKDAGVTTEIAFLTCRERLDAVRQFYATAFAGAQPEVLVEPTMDRKELRVRFVTPGRAVTLTAKESPGPPVRTTLSLVWQEER